MSAFAGLTRERAIDAAIFALVFLFTLFQVDSEGFGDQEEVATGIDGLGTALALGQALPVLWRRRAPWAVFLVTLGFAFALAALGYGVHLYAGSAIAIYTLATRLERTAVLPLFAIAAVAYVALLVVQSFELDLAIEDFISPALFWAGAWVIGDNRRTNQIRAAQEREQAERDQELTIAEERTRIARELHDSAGHAITNIVVQAGAARVLHERDPVRSREALLAIEDLARETLGDIDRIVGALREGESAPLVPLPGLDGIGDLVERHRAGGLDFNLELHGDPGSAVPQPVERTAYRIAQEALTNAARHGTGTAELVVEYGPTGLELVVTNPVRVGASQATPGGGRGIIGMRERALLLGGSLEATPVGDRFRVRAELPYDRDRR